MTQECSQLHHVVFAAALERRDAVAQFAMVGTLLRSSLSDYVRAQLT